MFFPRAIVLYTIFPVSWFPRFQIQMSMLINVYVPNERSKVMFIKQHEYTIYTPHRAFFKNVW